MSEREWQATHGLLGKMACDASGRQVEHAREGRWEASEAAGAAAIGMSGTLAICERLEAILEALERPNGSVQMGAEGVISPWPPPMQHPFDTTSGHH